MNWYYFRSEVDGKPVWIKKTKAHDDLAQPDKLQTSKETLEGPILLDPKDYQPGDVVEVTHHPPVDLDNCIPFEEFLAMLKDVPVQPFKPCVFFNAHCPGGMLEVYWKNSGYYVTYEGVRGQHLALCKDFETDEIVGVKIEDIASLKLWANPD
jgi:hypothetical protein